MRLKCGLNGQPKDENGLGAEKARLPAAKHR
jgi:hypothetical protein